MEKIITILLILVSIALNAQVNVKNYGASGNGITDDTVPINDAIAAAQKIGADVYLPYGKYFCNTITSPIISGSTNKILRLESNSMVKMKIYGERGTVIITPMSQYTLFYIYNKLTDLTIENIFFQSTHGITTNQTTGLSFAGTPSNNIKNLKITNCRFEGFSTAILGCGITGMTVEGCIFEAPLGHDNAQNSSQPAVYIWLADNSNGQCYDVKIINNVANGFSGTNITTTTTLRATDGFVFGYAYGLEYSGNTTKNFSEEHVLVSPATMFPYTTYPILISNNHFYQSVPTGSMKLGLPLISNYGVRADCNNVTISDNEFIDYSSGVLIYPILYPMLKQHGYKVSSNRFYAAKGINAYVYEAIKIQGSATSGNKCYNIVVDNNSIEIDSVDLKSTRRAIGIYNTEKAVLYHNNIFCSNITLNGFSFFGITYSSVASNVDESSNFMVNIPTRDYE